MRYLKRWQLAFVCLIALILPPVVPLRRSHAQAVNYTVTDLGTLGGPQSIAYGIDNCGRVVGESGLAGEPTSNPHPFFWSDGQITDMQTFGGASGGASALNDLGFASGNATTVSNDIHAFIWSHTSGAKTDIGVLPGGSSATANDINDANQMAGVSEINQFVNRGFVWQQSTGMQVVPPFSGSGSSTANGINNAGQVVGTASLTSGETHAFLLDGGVMTDLGTLSGGKNSVANEISEDGHVVGYSFLASNSASVPFHGFIWSSSTGMLDMGTLSGSSNQSIAYDINSAGQTVGTSKAPPNSDHAFIYTVATGMTDLNSLTPGSDWTLREARSINDRGQIVGFGTNPSGQTHGFLLTPDNVTPSPCAQAGSLQFNSATYSVSESGTKLTITVTRTGGVGGAVSVDYATSDGSATTADSDYQPASGTLNFAEGETSKTFDVNVNDDALFESNETVGLALSNPTGGAALGTPGTAVLTINNDDAAPSLSIGDVTQAEGSAGQAAFTFTVTKTGATELAASADFATANGTATTADNDYASNSGTVSFAANETTKTITVLVTGDTKFESDEDFFVNLSNPSGATIGDNQGKGTITNDDDAPVPGSLQFSSATYSAGEGGGTATITVTRTGGSSGAISVSYATSDGTATAGQDYTATSGTLSFADGETSKTFAVAIIEDSLDETDETVGLALSNPTGGAALGTPGTAALTITDNDAVPTVSVNDASLTEGDSGTQNMTFTATLSAPSGQNVSVHFDTADSSAIAGSDYDAASGTINIPAGSTSATFNVAVRGDTTDEADETFLVNLSNPSNATIGDGQGVGTISDNDAAPSLSINDVTVTEGNSGTVNAAFNVALSAASGKIVTVVLNTADGTATTAGDDYTSITNVTLTFNPGEPLSKTVNVAVKGDVVFETNETFAVNLTNPVNATTADAQGLGTINNDDAAPVFSIGDVTLSEGNAGTTAFTFTVAKTGATQLPASVDFATADGTAHDHNPASEDNDYAPISNGTLTLAANELSQQITVLVTGDTKFESDEDFFVNLSNPSGATIGDSQGKGTITNDDDAPVPGSLQFSSATYSAGEGSMATITVTRTGGKDGAVSVDYATATTPNNGTATAGQDYTATSGTLNFADGETSKTFTVSILDDNFAEASETVGLTLSNPTVGATLGTPGTATLTITDNDAQPSFSIGDVTLSEGNAGTTAFIFTVTKTGATALASGVNFATADGTATFTSGDYTSNSGTVSFAANETTKQITVLVTGDAVAEASETFFVNLSGATNATISGTQGQGKGTISNDDASLSISDVTVPEGNSGTVNAAFDVSIPFPTVNTVTVNFATSDGTATAAGGDYTPTSGSVTLNPGDTSKTVNVTVNGDTIDESNEVFFVNLSGATGATVSDSQGQGTIADDDGAPSLAISDVTLTEGNSGTTDAVFTVSLLPASGQTVTVNFATADITATAGSDYVSNSGQLIFAPGEVSKTVTVQVNGDTSNEADESFFVNLSGATNAVFADSQGVGIISNDDAPRLQFSQAAFDADESLHFKVITVTRTGDASLPVTVDYVTSDGTASQRNDYTFGFGTLRFAAGETTKSFELLLTNDAFQEPDETINLALSNPTGGAALGGQSTATVTVAANDNTPQASNPIDDPSFFVRMHYHDFFGRRPDDPGLAFWTGGITSCGSNAQCREVKRIDTSAAFFLSIEFQNTGYLVERIYKTAFGDATGSSTLGGAHTLPVPIVRLNEFLPDTQRIGQGVIIGTPGADAQLEANKNAFVLGFVQRQRFTDAGNYPLSLTPAEVVDRMNQRAGGVLTQDQRNQLVAQLTASSDVASGRANVLRQIAENATLNANENNRAFVLMQFFGYLRRNPNDPQDTDYTGYDFWLQKLNGFGGDFRKAEMVKAFISSIEYRQRFGQ